MQPVGDGVEDGAQRRCDSESNLGGVYRPRTPSAKLGLAITESTQAFRNGIAADGVEFWGLSGVEVNGYAAPSRAVIDSHGVEADALQCPLQPPLSASPVAWSSIVFLFGAKAIHR